MAYRSKEALAGQVQSEIERLNSEDGLPFRELLDEKRLLAALQTAGIEFRDRIYNPMVTLWAFLSQAMGGGDPSCANAVSRVLVDRVRRNLKPCSTNSSSYCTARQRLHCLVEEARRRCGVWQEAVANLRFSQGTQVGQG